jgi:rhodanese-related sulfurtransferase
MSIKYIAIIIFAAAVAGYLFYQRAGIASADQKKEWIAKGALIVDVRTHEEYRADHYKGSVNIPLAEIGSRLEEFGAMDNKIVLYCRTGNRSGQAKRILERNGFENVINAGGLKHMRL